MKTFFFIDLINKYCDFMLTPRKPEIKCADSHSTLARHCLVCGLNLLLEFFPLWYAILYLSFLLYYVQLHDTLSIK